MEERKAKEKVLRAAGKLGPNERLKPSRHEQKYRNELRCLDARIARRAHDAIHKFTTVLVESTALVGYEGLNIKGMTASAKGTVEEQERTSLKRAD